MTPIFFGAKKVSTLTYYAAKSGVFPRLFEAASKICKLCQALNYRIHTHKKSLHSEVDMNVYENCPSKIENHFPVTLPHHDMKKEAESVPDRKSRGGKSKYASNFRENRSCTNAKLRIWNWGAKRCTPRILVDATPTFSRR